MARSEKTRRRRQRAWEAQQGLCYYCKRSVAWKDATLEHLLPRAWGGRNTPDNLAMACASCNRYHARNVKEAVDRYAPTPGRRPKIIERMQRVPNLDPQGQRLLKRLLELQNEAPPVLQPS